MSCLFKYEILSIELISSKANLFSSINDIITTCAVIIAGLFSYIKFFKGRTFLSKAALDIKITIIEIREDANLHSVKVICKNIGSLTILNPNIILAVTKLSSGDRETEVIKKWSESYLNNDGENRITTLNSNEEAYFTFEREYKNSNELPRSKLTGYHLPALASK